MRVIRDGQPLTLYRLLSPPPMRLFRGIFAATYDVAEKSSLTLRQPFLTYTCSTQKQPMVVVNDAATSYS